jgi:hypothetical protein
MPVLLSQKIAPIRQKLIDHPLYANIKTLEHLRIFMEHHVFAVWDFMSLLKSLQRHLTCTQLPWKPMGSASTRYLINEIVCGEESDLDENGQRYSHFELYLKAMEQSGANKKTIQDFISQISSIDAVDRALGFAQVPVAAADFVKNTFYTIIHEEISTQAAVFTFGREDLIPYMFTAILQKIDIENPGKIGIFKYYIQRHIEVDGAEHSHLALQMTEELCGKNPEKWATAETAVIQALEARIKLWDAIYAQFN